MLRFWLSLAAWLVLASAEHAGAAPASPETQVAQIEALFSMDADLLAFKLKVDALVDPQMDAASVSTEVDELSSALLPMAANARNSHEKLKVLRRFLYESGPWNEYRPFSYDLAITKGGNPQDKLLSGYLKTRKGNCVTMPILLAVLGQRLGLDMALALAPFHVFVKLKDEQGKEWNIEATSGGGYTRDLWYRQEIPMNDLAVSKGTYMRALTPEETKAVLAWPLMEVSLAQRRHEQTAITASVLLSHYPGFVSALLFRGSASAYILREQVLPLYPDANEMPPAIRAYADSLLMQNRQDFAAAEALGWNEKDGIKP